MGRRVVIVGAGAAGSAAAAVLTEAGADVEIVVVGDEGRPPYNRTTVNKGLLSGAVGQDAIALPPLTGDIHWRLDSAAVALNRATREIRLSTGERLAADAVIVATGATPRPLPVEVDDAATRRVITLRTAADTARLRETLSAPGMQVLIAGAGLIGTETASVLTRAGHAVTLVDTASAPMSRVVGPTVARWIAEAHHRAGVDLRTQTSIIAVTAENENDPLTVALSDGTEVQPAVVVACLGVQSNTDWFAGTAAPGRYRPVVVDGWQRVSGWPGIYAAGDVAAVPGPTGTPTTVEHWGAALAQGRTAAHAVLADLGLAATPPPPAPEPPSYATYVHDVKLTILGWPERTAAEIPLFGVPGDDRFAIVFADQERRIVGAVGVGGARAVNRVKALIAAAAPVEELDQCCR